jgi:two-component system, chemotaxis family, CheB/CheR fusion protein
VREVRAVKSNGMSQNREKGSANGKGAVRPKDDLLIVAIGASAGGIEASTELLRNMPTNTGMAFVIVQHLDPKHQSFLTELLSKETKMKVLEVKNGMEVQPNHVYVIPPNASMAIHNQSLQLGTRGESRTAHMSIDDFMRTLAQEQGNRAIGVILSGLGTDGTLGMTEIQAQGGVTFAQEEKSAKFDGMPHSAIASGCVDYVLPPKGIARELARIAQHPYVTRSDTPEIVKLVPAENLVLSTILELLRLSTGVDFTNYRQTTILRRIHRRMVVQELDRLEDYAKYLQSNPGEVKKLYQDILINVTSFFRNPQVFDALKSEVFPKILKNHSLGSSLRIWTPGCASGEETYSIAIGLLEFLGDKATRTSVQFFGTDVSESSILKARAGAYPENIQADVSPERLRRYITKVEGGHRISKNIRDMCIFAQHNLANDPPFSQMNLICCRNLLIYLEPTLQMKVISLFHYALRPGGFLVLGTSEGIGSATNLFELEDRGHKIFSKKASATRQLVTFSLGQRRDRGDYGIERVPLEGADANLNYLDAQKEFDRRLLAQFAPATVFINEDLDVVHTRGDVTRYLKLAPGRASLNILRMAREGLPLDLRNAISRARKERGPVRKQGVQIKIGNGNGESRSGRNSTRRINFEVVPITLGNLKDFYFMIVFEDATETARKKWPDKQRTDTESATRRIAKLEQELAATKEYLQSVIETHEATNEELQSANEEILSSNEELQSTNEELETAKEELQSANEELSTVNDELRSRNMETTQMNNDLMNLLSSIDLAVVMVGSDLMIRRVTPRAQKILGLIPGDIGRPLININPSIEIPQFQATVVQVMTDLEPVEKELADPSGGRYLLRILPSRTSDNKVDGVVVTLMEIPEQAASSKTGR